MLKRKMDDRLLAWKRTSKKALLVTGARQVGKSYSVAAFGRANYASFVEVNLALNKKARGILAQADDAVDFINRIALLTGARLVEGDTLVFIDEIQEYPDIVTIIKGLVEDGRYSYVFSGSMLGTEFKGITSFPVGYVEQVTMRPLDFEEFCWAVGVQQRFLDELRTCFVQRRPVDGYLHEIMDKNFRAYMVAGGMPEVVQNYVDGGFSLVDTRALQAGLVRQYAQDIGKYAEKRAFEVRAVFDRIPVQLEDEAHRFVVSALEGPTGKAGRFSQYDRDFLWLVNAGVALRVPQVTEARSPLRRTEVDARFKLYQSDTGMLVARYPQGFARAAYLDMRDYNLGGIYENVVAQELAAAGIGAWYYQSEAVGEVDFVIEGRHGRVVPLEVKSGRKVHAHAALDRLLAVDEYKIREAVVFSHNNLSQEGRVLYAPFYMLSCVDELVEGEGGAFTFAPALP